MLRPWDFKIVVNRKARAAVYLQIAHAIIEEIRRGRLAPGSVLPGTRELAESLSINRKTVIQAFDELVAQGWVTTDGTRGTFVSSHLPTVDTSRNGRNGAREPKRTGMPSQPDFQIRGSGPDLSLQLAGKGMLAFDDGAPDTRLLPVNQLARAYRHAVVSSARANRLGYGDPRGTETLREAVSTMLNVDRGLTTTPDNICITRGSQMAIYLAARMLVGPGDTVVVEELSYPPAREAFRAAGATVVGVGLDEKGMNIEELEKLCRRRRVRAVYVTPHHQFPTTVLMKPERRLRLLALADQFGFAIVEDDYDHEFHFAHQPLLPLASVDLWGKVFYIGSMSKLIAPSLRLGYIAAPVPVVDRAAAEIMLIDRQGDPATEMAIAEMMEQGDVHRHTRKVLRVYEERREILAELLRINLGDLVNFILPEGGLALWLRFSAEIDPDELIEEAARGRLRLISGRTLSTSGSPVAGTRLGFASLGRSELAEGVSRLTKAIKKATTTRRTPSR